jgi:hypothetical protein
MTYNEAVQASIVAYFYKALVKKGEQGLAVFKKAVQYYAEQRGRRMALRALRDGRKLTWAAYAAYGEWFSTLPMKAEASVEDGDKVTTISDCPWARTFAGLGLTECGKAYCDEIDLGLARGFNPDLVFELRSYLHDSDRCVQVCKGFDPAEKIPVPADGKKDWKYHCAHTLSAFGEITAAAGFGEAVEEAKVEFAAAFGGEALAAIENAGINFNVP